MQRACSRCYICSSSCIRIDRFIDHMLPSRATTNIVSSSLNKLASQLVHQHQTWHACTMSNASLDDDKETSLDDQPMGHSRRSQFITPTHGSLLPSQLHPPRQTVQSQEQQKPFAHNSAATMNISNGAGPSWQAMSRQTTCHFSLQPASSCQAIRMPRLPWQSHVDLLDH